MGRIWTIVLGGVVDVRSSLKLSKPSLTMSVVALLRHDVLMPIGRGRRRGGREACLRVGSARDRRETVLALSWRKRCRRGRGSKACWRWRGRRRSGRMSSQAHLAFSSTGSCRSSADRGAPECLVEAAQLERPPIAAERSCPIDSAVPGAADKADVATHGAALPDHRAARE